MARCRATTCLLALSCALAEVLPASAQTPATADAPPVASPAPQALAHDRSYPLSTTIGFESVAFPAGERMGLLGMSLLLNGGGAWWIGPAVYGAASGERGGLFVGGAELQYRWRLGPGQLVAGMFAGGGGGAAAPVGGGLMLRPALTWLHDFRPVQAGISASAVRFPSGDISSRQLGLVLAWDGTFRYADPVRAGAAAADTSRSGIGVDRLVGTVTTYALRDGRNPERRIGLVGARLVQDRADAPLGGQWHWGVETAGAASGDAAGYMEVLGTLGWDVPLTAQGDWRAGLRGALGLGGGGAVPTGGGGIAKAALNTAVQLTPTLATGIELGWLAALDTSLRAPTAQLWLSWALEPPPSGGGLRSGTIARTEWTTAIQHYAHGERRDGGDRALDTLGLKLNRFFGDHWYGTVQGHTAISGGAGAYGVGLVGAGVATSSQASPWRAGVEVMVGASGGGGVDSGGGSLAQALAWAGWTFMPDLELRIGAGVVRSKGGSLLSPIVELSISRGFGLMAP
jgi:hypothetical protein